VPDQDDAAARRERISRVWFALLAWVFVTTGVGFLLGRTAVGSGHGAALYLYGSWLVGLLGFAATAAYILRKPGK